MSAFPVRTALFVSLAFNLLLVGGAIGAYAAGVRIERPGEAGVVAERLPGPRAFMSALAPTTRATVRNDLLQTAAQTRTLRETARQARQDVFEAARAEPYNVDRMRAAFAHMRDADAAVVAEFHNSVSASLAHMTPEERREALTALRPRAAAARPASDATESGSVDRPAPGAEPGSAERPVRGEFRERARERWRERLRERRQQQP